MYVFPYLIAVLPKVVEVQLMETQATVQSMSLRASRIAAAPGARAAFLVANNCTPTPCRPYPTLPYATLRYPTLPFPTLP